jgi:hypothetical protein
MGKNEETEIAVECSVLVFFDFNKFEKRSDIIIRRSMFDVGSSSFNMFDVHLSKQFRTALM